MFNKILIANRGEIAVRVIRACRELGVKTVAVYSEADRESRHLKLADEAVCVGPGPATTSYLKYERVLAAAQITGADAIHPGYGFLSENAAFARACEKAGVVFIGPPIEAISALGDKMAGKKLAIKSNVPVVPGTKGAVTSGMLDEVSKIGFPVMVKASAGGGGKGLRVVKDPKMLKGEMERASAEAQAAFGDGAVFVEKFIVRPRHVEIQILADKYGNVVACPERDCTVQRRHQKLIEESPSPSVTPEIRKKMQAAAIRLAESCNYHNVGTVEFLLDPDGNFYFIEVNTRLQVEHTVTETVTGLDLCREQILLAAGERLSFDQARASEIRSHSIENRINAEDASRDFAPCPGKIDNLILPDGPGVRVDTHLYSGYTVPSYYDSLLAKLIVGAPTRELAINRALRALDEFEIQGIDTTIPFHKMVLRREEFRAGTFDTSFVDMLQEKSKSSAQNGKHHG